MARKAATGTVGKSWLVDIRNAVDMRGEQLSPERFDALVDIYDRLSEGKQHEEFSEADLQIIREEVGLTSWQRLELTPSLVRSDQVRMAKMTLDTVTDRFDRAVLELRAQKKPVSGLLAGMQAFMGLVDQLRDAGKKLMKEMEDEAAKHLAVANGAALAEVREAMADFNVPVERVESVESANEAEKDAEATEHEADAKPDDDKSAPVISLVTDKPPAQARRHKATGSAT